MKVLGVLRHAKSDWSDATLHDFDRGLNQRGRRGAAVMGRHIAQYGVTWDRVIASPAERVRRTWEASGLSGAVEWERAAYLADGDSLIALLRAKAGESHAALLIGHNPGLQEVILSLVAPESRETHYDEVAEKYPTAAFAVLELDIADWADCAPGCGRIVHFVRPRDLDPDLGPKKAR